MKKMLPIGLTLFLWSILEGTSATPKAVDIEVLNQEASVYVLYDDGFIQTTGFAVSFGYPSKVDAVELVMTPTQKGYYVLEKDGTIHSFGDALILSNPSKGKIPYVDMKLFQATNSPYFLLQDGSIITIRDSRFYGELIRKTPAVDMELTPDGMGYYVLYEDGLIVFFGTAINRGYTETGRIKAVDMELTANGYYVILEDGTILTFGNAIPMPYRTKPISDVTDLILTTEGYRILTADGEVEEFIRVDAQGTSRWFAQVSARSVAPLATATNPPTPTHTPTPTRTPRPGTNYFSFSGSGFSEKIVGKLPNTYSIPSSPESGFTSLLGGGLFIAVSESQDQPARKILYFSLKESTDINSTGKLFASLTPERGSAFIRGLAYSRNGLYVVVSDNTETLIVTIQGNFEESNVTGFSLF